MSVSFIKKGIYCWILLLRCTFSYAQVAVPVEETASDKLSTNRQLSTANRQLLSDSALLDLVQKQTFKYFWDFSHPVSGLARERSNTTPAYGNEVVTTGGSGFGVMAIIVATERDWISRDTAVK